MDVLVIMMHFKPAQITSMQKIHKPGSLLDKYELHTFSQEPRSVYGRRRRRSSLHGICIIFLKRYNIFNNSILFKVKLTLLLFGFLL